MKKYNCIYKIDQINKNSVLNPDGYTCLLFRNLGDETVKIDNSIILEQGDEFKLNNLPDVEIATSFSIVFSGFGENPNLLIIKSYFNTQEK